MTCPAWAGIITAGMSRSRTGKQAPANKTAMGRGVLPAQTRVAHLRVLGRDDEVGHHAQLAAAGQRVAVDLRDRDLVCAAAAF